jgi:hypothetical protein
MDSMSNRILLLSAAILAAVLVIPLPVFSQAAQTKPAARTQTAPAPGTSEKETTPIDWPREIARPTGKVVIYQPQIDEWPDYKLVKVRSAIAFLPKGQTEPKPGIIEMQARTEVDFESRLVKLTRIQITGVNFPGSTKEKTRRHRQS